MRFMILRKADAQTEAGEMPSEQLIADMTAYNAELVKAGVMLAGEGLHPSSRGARVKFSKGKPTVIDGPFAEARELVAGFTMIEVGSYEEALEWVRRWPVTDGNGEVDWNSAASLKPMTLAKPSRPSCARKRNGCAARSSKPASLWVAPGGDASHGRRRRDAPDRGSGPASPGAVHDAGSS